MQADEPVYNEINSGDARSNSTEEPPNQSLVEKILSADELALEISKRREKMAKMRKERLEERAKFWNEQGEKNEEGEK